MNFSRTKSNARATKTFDFAITKTYFTKDASPECIVEGLANTVDKDRVGDVVLPSAFKNSLPMYMTNSVLLLGHDWDNVAGTVQHAEITDKGLFIRARISDAREDLKTMVREGCLKAFSIGYNELDSDFDEVSKTKTIKDLELLEISIVAVPANPHALFTVKREAAAPTKCAQSEKLAADGLDADQIAAITSIKPCCDPCRAAAKSLSPNAGAYHEFISAVRDASGGDELGAEHLTTCCEFLKENGDKMKLTKKELLEKLRATLKSAGLNTEPAADPAAVTTPAAKAEAAAPPAAGTPPAHPPGTPPAAAAPAADDFQKQVMAKLDAIAQALVQMAHEDAQEDSQEDSGAPAAAGSPPPGKAAEVTPGEKSFANMTDAELDACEAAIDAANDELDDEIDEEDSESDESSDEDEESDSDEDASDEE